MAKNVEAYDLLCQELKNKWWGTHQCWLPVSFDVLLDYEIPVHGRDGWLALNLLKDKLGATAFKVHDTTRLVIFER